MSDEARSIDDIVADARDRIERHSPSAALAAQRAGAVIVDTRDSADRSREGAIPGALWVPRNLLEWRADPAAEYADERIADRSLRLIVVCNDGYSSSLAAASLRELGFAAAGDVVGGYRAWVAAGLPTEPAAAKPS